MQGIIQNLKVMLPYITNIKSKVVLRFFIEDGFENHQKHLYHELKRILQFQCYKPEGEKWINATIVLLEFYDPRLKSIGYFAAIQSIGQPHTL
jgi:hypothetical protein